jgi:hypothetical protein
MDEPPTKAKPSAESKDASDQLDAAISRDVLRAAETCRERFDENQTREAYQLGEILDALGRHPYLIDPVYRLVKRELGQPSKTRQAVVTEIGGVRVRRPAMEKDPKTGKNVPVADKEGFPVYQRVGKGRQWEGPSMVRVAAAAIENHADPLDVATAIIAKLPPLLRADCRKANRDPDQVGLAIADLLIDDETGKRKQGWRDPAAVLRAILRELGHPRSDNVTREREPNPDDPGVVPKP